MKNFEYGFFSRLWRIFLYISWWFGCFWNVWMFFLLIIFFFFRLFIMVNGLNFWYNSFKEFWIISLCFFFCGIIFEECFWWLKFFCGVRFGVIILMWLGCFFFMGFVIIGLILFVFWIIFFFFFKILLLLFVVFGGIFLWMGVMWVVGIFVLLCDWEFWYVCDIIKEFWFDFGFIIVEFCGVLIDDEWNRNIFGGFGGGFKLWFFCVFLVLVLILDMFVIGMLLFFRFDFSFLSFFCFWLFWCKWIFC